MKKQYQSPMMEEYTIKSQQLLAGSDITLGTGGTEGFGTDGFGSKNSWAVTFYSLLTFNFASLNVGDVTLIVAAPRLPLLRTTARARPFHVLCFAS